MPDLLTRFRGADHIPAPDLWDDIERREPQPARSGLSAPRRVAIALLAFAVAAVGFAFAIRGFRRTSTPSRPASPSVANGMIWVRVGGGDGPSFVYQVDPSTSEVTPLWNDQRGRVLPGQPNRDAIGEQYAWSPDGSELAFSDYSGHGTEIFLLIPYGTHRSQLTRDGGLDSFPSWSPDGAEIAYASDTGSPPSFDSPYYTPGCEYSLRLCPSQIYAINVDGTGKTKLTDDPVGATMPAWSPDGSTIAFVGGAEDPNGDIYVMGSDGNGVRQLTSGLAFDSSPEWSPDGARIAFIRSTQAGESLEMMNADGTNLHEVTPIPTSTLGAFAWSPDGTEIAYDTGGDEHAGELFLIRPEGTEVDRIVVASGYGLGHIAWQPVPATTSSPSPTETTTPAPPTPASHGVIAFGWGTGIYTMDPDGGGLTLLRDPGAVAYYGPEWSPDGTKIAFYGYPQGGGSGYGGGADYDVFVMNADGSGLTNLTTSPADVKSGFSQMIPRWSPDGTKIAYDGDDGLYVMNADGSGQTRIAAGQDPSWSPDGTRIAFEGPGGAIWSVASDGSGLTRLTSGAGFDGFPAYSPDGTRIAYYHGQGSDRAIYVMNADGSGQTAVADFQADTMGRPMWSPDGTEIAFDLLLKSCDEHGTWDVYVASADGSGVTDLTPTPNRDENTPVWSPDGTEIAFEASEVLACNIDNAGTFDVYVMDPDGSGQTRLTQDVHSMGFDMSWQTNAT